LVDLPDGNPEVIFALSSSVKTPEQCTIKLGSCLGAVNLLNQKLHDVGVLALRTSHKSIFLDFNRLELEGVSYVLSISEQGFQLCNIIVAYGHHH